MINNIDFVVATVQGDDIQRYLRWHPDKSAFGYAIGAEVMLVSDHQSELAALREENERLKSESFEGLYNAVIDERDALREELATMTTYRDNAAKKIFRLRAKLTAAEQRNVEAMPLLLFAFNSGAMPRWWSAIYADLLKPTESGASE